MGSRGDDTVIDTASFSSTKLAGASWDSDTGDLTVTFIRGDERTYSQVPQDVWEKWKTSWSPGRFFIDEIQDKYE